jgi:class 3 adenylate cyclase
MSETRKLAAILVSDVVGYSRLGGTDEGACLPGSGRSALPDRPCHRRPPRPHNGDGSIIEFRSVVDAVGCAIEVRTDVDEERPSGLVSRFLQSRRGVGQW